MITLFFIVCTMFGAAVGGILYDAFLLGALTGFCVALVIRIGIECDAFDFLGD